MTGLTVASRLDAEGVSVAVLEADRLGHGTTGHTTGKLTSQHGLIYQPLISRYGTEVAAAYAEANQQAIDQIEKQIATMDSDCAFRRLPAYVYTQDPGKVGDLEAEHAAAEGLGLPSSMTDDIGLPFSVEAAVRFEDQAAFHVGLYLSGLAGSLSDSSYLFENSRATSIDERAGQVTVHTSSGRVRAGHAVVATLIPFNDRTTYFARMRATRAYGVAALLNGDGVEGMHINVDSPTRSTRPWNADSSSSGVIVVGEDHAVGHGRSAPGRWGALERWARAHFDVASFEYRWSAQDFEPVDALPFVGPAPLSRATLVATGFNKWGLTNATAAADVIVDLIAGRDNRWAAAFDSTRLGDLQAMADTIELNLHIGKSFVLDRVQRFFAPDIAELAHGEGGLVRSSGETVAAYREPDGEVHAVSPTCTHLGCTINWNHAEKSWDCPCHGSRFGIDGAVLNGPATRPLDRVEVDQLDG
jgi:glycine/D-amino acid oxidase-like deaminating enzyme/nitrite reductase/ring-hydroxylating ferredoxin subunit